MFLAGLKLGLGFLAGWLLLSFVAAFALIGVARFDCWREKRLRLQWEAKANALRHATARFSELANGRLSKSSETEHLRGC